MEEPAQSFGGRVDGLLNQHVNLIEWRGIEPGMFLAVPRPFYVPQSILDEATARLGGSLTVEKKHDHWLYRWKREGAAA
jgi:hypothetical protein